MDVTAALEAENIIPDVLAPDTKVPCNLKVVFPSARLEKPGEMIDRDATKYKPTVFVDPDLTRRHDTRFGQVRHWLTTKAAISHSGEVIDSKNTTISSWVGPAPLPGHFMGGKPHPSRYTFILCQHRNEDPPAKFDVDSMRAHYEGLPGELGYPSQDMIDRWKFNTQQFMDRNDLEVVGATYMLVEGDLRSGMANMGLAAEAIANKAVGR
ncbi:hypothetical protein T310_7416 [Rasamsonia emersonii CBS 393.64]|uniref:Uncharacterized protein n=1 Tax=Rasamsonia emersonii (strain ATCC 16479 / CBS 393.64 / IMI 116815) TaxID=1408163 RepID=A0A0F4YLB6_RASE3|nr:hypothetical protein T310_7416 [Rasamsonia emersonii CBS 393.64]KKA18631.1 hypothetical protein T310_7416 [Rasamsonia emersonii CBS 393.64]